MSAEIARDYGRKMSRSVEVFSPAKINLFLAVTGRRPDGYHELVSVAAPLDWGDRLRAEALASGGDELRCDDPGVPADERNLVLRAARAFREASGWRGGVRFSLEKRIPVGAGLGGGSSNAAAALRALDELAGRPLGPGALAGVAARVGSDCALFLEGGPVIMRGRGELIEPLPPEAAARLSGRRVLVFKPGFPVSTAWAYGRLAELGDYLEPGAAAARLEAWVRREGAPAEELLFNQFEKAVFAKFPALPALLERLRGTFGLGARMSGSGSACFALLPPERPPPPASVAAAIREAWGPGAAIAEAGLAARAVL